MAGLGSSKLIDVKKLFFDRAAVVKALDKAKLKFLAKAGAYVMTRARQSIRSAKSSSSPGSPPNAHGRKLLKRNIFFALDRGQETTFVGPIFRPPVNGNKDGQPVGGTVPSVLEYGGVIRIVEVFQFGRWRRVGQGAAARNSTGLATRIRTVRVMARPFMAPALAKEAVNFPAMLAGTFKK